MASLFLVRFPQLVDKQTLLDHAPESHVSAGFEETDAGDKVDIEDEFLGLIGSLKDVQGVISLQSREESPQDAQACNIVLYTFTATHTTENVVTKLRHLGIGSGLLPGSGIAVTHLDSSYRSNDDITDISARDSFWASRKKKLNIEEAIKSVEEGARLSFDYVVFLLAACLLAAVGLVRDDQVTLVASMLVSPIMGPILSMVFGTVVYDRKLVKIGCVSEVVSLVVCVAVGFVVGLITTTILGPFPEWPPPAIWTRTTVDAIYASIATAIPSGIGVAVSVLKNNQSSLVGVAISAALLPPTVNTGIIWAWAALAKDTNATYAQVAKMYGPNEADVSRNLQRLQEEGGVQADIFTRGLVSLSLCLINIVFIYLMAILLFRIKEVTPTEGPVEWASSIAYARAYSKTVRGSGPHLPQQLGLQLKNVMKETAVVVDDEPPVQPLPRTTRSAVELGSDASDSIRRVMTATTKVSSPVRSANELQSIFAPPESVVETPDTSEEGRATPLQDIFVPPAVDMDV